MKNNPELLDQWHPSKNVDINPDSLGANSHKKAWWIGPCGHEWLGTISNRVTENAGCPICANKRVLAGFNDLATQSPEIMLDWDYSKNTVDPTTITKSSRTECFWKCHLCGHEWRASPRVRRDSPCSVCSSVKRISLAEKSIAYYLSKTTEVWENYVPDYLGRQEIDVFLPRYNIGIEYDGGHYHRNIERDLRKNRLCEENGVILIRVRADCLPRLDNCITIDVDESSKDGLNKALIQLIQTINRLTGESFEFDVDVARDSNPIREARYTYYVENSFAKNHLECLNEVHPTKNGNLNLEMVSEFSVLRIHWICSKGHEWTSTIANRASGHGCPYCAGIRVCPGENDLKKL